MEMDTTMNAVVEAVVGAVMHKVREVHTVDVDVDVASNTEGGDTATRTGTTLIPAQSMKIPQTTKLQQHSQK